jgi:hypothetical protein
MAGGKNLEYLLYQTVFDTEESSSLTRAIDKGLADGSLNTLSIKALKSLGKHFSQDKDGKAWIGKPFQKMKAYLQR